MFNAFFKTAAAFLSASLGLSATALSWQDEIAGFRPKAHTVLGYANRSTQSESEFIVRVARYGPDIVLEWETTTDQGTLHLHESAVEGGEGFTLSRYFEVGVHNESSDEMTLWLSRLAYDDLVRKGSAKIKWNRLPLKITNLGQDQLRIRVNQKEVDVPVVRVQDSRGNSWAILADPENPLVVEYVSRYYRQRLKYVVSASRPTLRWIKKLPEIK